MTVLDKLATLWNESQKIPLVSFWSSLGGCVCVWSLLKKKCCWATCGGGRLGNSPGTQTKNRGWRCLSKPFGECFATVLDCHQFICFPAPDPCLRQQLHFLFLLFWEMWDGRHTWERKKRQLPTILSSIPETFGKPPFPCLVSWVGPPSAGSVMWLVVFLRGQWMLVIWIYSARHSISLPVSLNLHFTYISCFRTVPHVGLAAISWAMP